MNIAIKQLKSVISTLGHWILWTRRNEHISLLRIFIAAVVYGLAMAAWVLLRGGDHEHEKFFLELVVIVFTAISVFEISDGVVLGKTELETLKQGGKNAALLTPKLLIDASQKCKVGLVFIVYAWLADLTVKYLL
jgi:hypothetical protein